MNLSTIVLALVLIELLILILGEKAKPVGV
jgi:hypothetical protein